MTVNQIYSKFINKKDISFANWIEVEKFNYENSSDSEPFDDWIDTKYSSLKKKAFYKADGEMQEGNKTTFDSILKLLQQGVSTLEKNEENKTTQGSLKSEQEAFARQQEIERKTKAKIVKNRIIGAVITTILVGGAWYGYKYFIENKKL